MLFKRISTYTGIIQNPQLQNAEFLTTEIADFKGLSCNQLLS
jgi:hypothetical protein